jgi:hypothetical protein
MFCPLDHGYVKDTPIFAVIVGWRWSSGSPVLLLFSFPTTIGAWFPRAGVLVSRLLLGARLEDGLGS